MQVYVQGNTWICGTHVMCEEGNTWVGDTPVVDGQVYEWGNTWSGGTQALSVSSKTTQYCTHNTLAFYRRPERRVTVRLYFN